MNIAVISLVSLLSNLFLTVTDNQGILRTGRFTPVQIMEFLERDWILPLTQSEIELTTFPTLYVDRLMDLLDTWIRPGLENAIIKIDTIYTYEEGAIFPSKLLPFRDRAEYTKLIRFMIFSYLSCFNHSYQDCFVENKVKNINLPRRELVASLENVQNLSRIAFTGEFYILLNNDMSIAFMITANLQPSGIYIYNVCASEHGLAILRKTSYIRTTEIFRILLACVRYRLGSTLPMMLSLVNTNPSFGNAYTIYNNNGFKPTIDKELAILIGSGDPKDVMPMTTGPRVIYEAMELVSGQLNPLTNVECPVSDNILAVAYKHHCFYKNTVQQNKTYINDFTETFMSLLAGTEVPFDPTYLISTIPPHLTQLTSPELANLQLMYTRLYNTYESYRTDPRPHPVLTPENLRIQLLNSMSESYHSEHIDIVNKEILMNSYFSQETQTYDDAYFKQGIFACKNIVNVKIFDYRQHPDPMYAHMTIQISTGITVLRNISIMVPPGEDLTTYTNSLFFRNLLTSLLGTLDDIEFPQASTTNIDYHCHRFLWSNVVLKHYDWDPVNNQSNFIMSHANSVLFDTHTKNTYYFEPSRLIPASSYTTLRAMHRIYARVFGRKIVQQIARTFPAYNATGGRIISLNEGYTACGLRLYSHVQDPSLDDESQILCLSLSMLSIVFFDMMISISLKNEDLVLRPDDRLASVEIIDFRKISIILRYWMDSAKLLRELNAAPNTSSFFLTVFPIYALFIKAYVSDFMFLPSSISDFSDDLKRLIETLTVDTILNIDIIINKFNETRNNVVTLLRSEPLIQILLKTPIPDAPVYMQE
jgi:hypothetical protein